MIWPRRQPPAVLIACGASKLDEAARALDLYQGPLFRSAREWALTVTVPERIWIVSALWGLVPARSWLEPYEHRATDVEALIEVLYDQLASPLGDLAAESGPVFFIGGGLYARALRHFLPNNLVTLSELLPPGRETRGIGAQRAWLARHHGRLP